MSESQHKQALPPGFLVNGYRVVDVLGVGGFGVTYLARHDKLGHRVAIKEYLPNEFAVRDGTTVHPKSTADASDFEWGLARFLDEAKTLARFEHRNVVRVRDYFEANHTAYIVMDYEDGEPLDSLLMRHGTLTENQLKRVLLPIVDGLREVHAAGFLHRDIKPSNIFVRRDDESPVLLDFGAARQALGRKSKSLTAVASAGYSPPEQYESDGEQSASTDIYALSALCYRAITGEAPPEAPRRLNRLAQGQEDPLETLVELSPPGFSATLLDAVDRGLAVGMASRPTNLDDWLVRLAGNSAKTNDEARVGPTSPPQSTRRGWTWGAACATAVLALAAGAWLWIEYNGTEPVEPSSIQVVSEEPNAQANPLAAAVTGGGALLVAKTEPPGVEVLVDDTPVGKTPFERSDIRTGSRRITLQHPHYDERTLTREFADDVVTSIDVALVRGTGKLTVVTEPRTAWIEHNGMRLAEGTPVTLEDMPAGPMLLQIAADEYRAVEVQADVPKDGVGRLEHMLDRKPASVLALERKLGRALDHYHVDKHGWTDLHWASAYGNSDAVVQLLLEGATVNAIAQRRNELDPLRQALADVKERATGEPKSFEQPCNGETNDFAPLHLAALCGGLGVAEALVERGANVDAGADTNTGTPLAWTIKANSIDVAHFLLQNGASANALQRASPRSTEMATLLLSHGTDVNSMDFIDTTADVARVILGAGFDVNATNDRGETILHRASANYDWGLVELLVEYGANIHAKTSWPSGPTGATITYNYGQYDRSTPLHWAAGRRRSSEADHYRDRRRKTLHMLVMLGADPDVKDARGETPRGMLIDSVERGNMERAFVEQLLLLAQ